MSSEIPVVTSARYRTGAINFNVPVAISAVIEIIPVDTSYSRINEHNQLSYTLEYRISFPREVAQFLRETGNEADAALAEGHPSALHLSSVSARKEAEDVVDNVLARYRKHVLENMLSVKYVYTAKLREDNNQ